MGNILLDGVIRILEALIGGISTVIAQLMHGLLDETLADAQLPWVADAVKITEALFVTLLGLRVLYVAVTQYILWNEGNGDTEGAMVVKGVFRSVAAAAIGAVLAFSVFSFGAQLAIHLFSIPLAKASTLMGGDVHKLEAIVNLSIGTLFISVLGLAIGIVLILVVTVQMAVRGAELVIYMIGAPLVALGQLSPDGGVWSGWWRGLVILSMTMAVQWLCVEGMLASVQAITGGAGAGVGSLATGSAINGAALIVIGWMVVAVMGSHLLKQWGEAHTGVGQGIMSVGRYALIGR